MDGPEVMDFNFDTLDRSRHREPVEFQKDPEVPHLETQLFSSNVNNVTPELMTLWETEKYMDVQLFCENKTLKAHRVVLAALSPVFRTVFMDIGPLTEDDCTIILPEVDAVVLETFLHSVYGGHQAPVLIDPSLNHLRLNEIVKTTIKGDSSKDSLRTLIKNEPGNANDKDTLLDDGDEEVRKFKLWQYFNIEDKDSVSCMLCQESIRKPEGFGLVISRHFDKFHRHQMETELLPLPPNLQPKQEPIDFDSFDTFDDDDLSGDAKAARSKVWKYFDKVEKDFSKCKTCFCIIKTQKGNTSGMSRHLSRVHPDLFDEYEQEKGKLTDIFDDSDDDFSPFKPLAASSKAKKKSAKPVVKKRANQKRTAKVWEYFEQAIDGTEAKCKFCLVMIKTESGNTSGLISHLRSSHAEQYDELQEDGEADSKSNSGARNSPVWQFYTEIGNNRVKCNKCETILKYYYGTTSGLLRHLRRSHPEDFDTIKTEENCDIGDVNESTLAMDNETIWKFFNRGEDPAKANCTNCLLEIADEHGSLITSCEEHLRASHTDLLEQYESQRKAFVQELIKNDKTAVKRKYTSRVVASAIWSFFKKNPTSPNVNQCLTCLIEVDCSQNSTAMVRHLEELHPEQHEAFKKSSGIEAKDIKKPSAIWKHFRATDDPKKHKCVVCGKEIICHFHTTSNMIRHLEHNHVEIFEEFLRESHGLEQSEDVNPLIKKPKKKNMKMKGGSTDPADRTCPDCGKEYSCRPAMLFHYKCVHSGIRPYKCEECGMTFARQDSWKGHTHSKVRSFLCSICGKTFARRNIRDTHERAHLNDRRYPCSFCGKKFMTNQQRTNHERTHTGEKPFQCTDCGRQFAQQHQLTTHIRIHTGEKPYSCVHCNQKFRHLSSRNNHKCDGKIAANQFAGNPAALATHITVAWTE